MLFACTIFTEGAPSSRSLQEPALSKVVGGDTVLVDFCFCGATHGTPSRAQDGQFVPVDYPWRSRHPLRGINDEGEIVGNFPSQRISGIVSSQTAGAVE